MLVFLESELFNVSVNTRQERELLFIAWEVMCMLSINTINHFIPLHSKKRCDDVGTVTLALCTFLMLETVAALPAVLPKPRCDTHLACTTAPSRGCSQLLSADPARWFSRLHTPGPFLEPAQKGAQPTAGQEGTVAAILPGMEAPWPDPGAVPGQDWPLQGWEQQAPTSSWASVCAPRVRKSLMVCVHGCAENWTWVRKLL